MVKNRLKVILAEKNISQLEVCNAIGISKATLSNIIAGRQNSTLEQALDMAKFLNVSVEDIFYKPSNDEGSLDAFTQLAETMDNLYQLYINNKFTRKDIITIFKGLIGNFQKDYGADILDYCYDYYIDTIKPINSIAENIIRGLE